MSLLATKRAANKMSKKSNILWELNETFYQMKNWAGTRILPPNSDVVSKYQEKFSGLQVDGHLTPDQKDLATTDSFHL